MTERRAGDLRTLARNAVRTQIAAVAVDLFAQHGFDSVTIEQVAEAAGSSVRSIYRYFPTKEDLVVGVPEDQGAVVRQALEARPVDEPPMVSLHRAYAEHLGHREHTDRDKAALRLLEESPALRARNLQKHMLWAELLSPVIEQRLHGGSRMLRAKALVDASLAAFTLALSAWAAEGEERPILDLLALVFRELEHP